MDTLVEILSELHPEINFKTHKNLIDEAILDSFDIVTIIAEISDKFDVQIPAEEIVPENFNSADALLQLIEKLEDN